MRTLKTRFQTTLSSRRAHLSLFISLALITLVWVGLEFDSRFRVGSGQPAHAQPLPPALVPVSDLTVQSTLSQAKWVQGEDGQLYLNLAIQPPALPISTGHQAPTDIVVVLDRSPSMLAANRFPYAKTAVRELLNQLGAEDRLGLIGFDRKATVYAGLTAVTPTERQRLTQLVQQMTVGSATNIGAGLQRAQALLTQQPTPRLKKIILLSDGETNTGITDPAHLAQLASMISAEDIVVSTIGLGLGFNEALMAALADHGMGHYAYLEQVNTLGHILAQELSTTRLLYAERSTIHLHLNPGVTLQDAAGYPVDSIDNNPAQLQIKTGQLLWGQRKNLMLTLHIPTQSNGDFTLGTLDWHFSHNGTDQQAKIDAEYLSYAVIEPEKKQEAIASIRPSVYRESWLKNNFGRMRQQVSQWVKAGNKGKAEAVINDYRRQVGEAEAASGLSMSSPKLETSLQQVKDELDDAFRGDTAERAVKQNRLSKKQQELSRKEQRQ